MPLMRSSAVLFLATRPSRDEAEMDDCRLCPPGTGCFTEAPARAPVAVERGESSLEST